MIKELVKNLANLPGWRTNRKLIIFESDDWGAIRMSHKTSFIQLSSAGILAEDKDEERYLKNDALASENDLSGLFDILSSVTDKDAKPAVFTAVSVVANPQFGKIKEMQFAAYFYEPFTETLKRYPHHSRSFELWQEGLSRQIFVPQFHGREHLNVANWLKALRQGNRDTLAAFEQEVYGISPRTPINAISYQAAFDLDDASELDYQQQVLAEGLKLFEQIHGYKANFFVPTNGPFNNSLESVIAKGGIQYIGASKIQLEPCGHGQVKRRFHWLGQRNKYGQYYITRNCFFEPSSALKTDWVDSCMSEIAMAFRWKKPAVISTHRANYIGWINPANRDNGLLQLRKLLSNIKKHWPDVEFITSSELGKLISKS